MNMRERKSANSHHPKYPEYVEKCKALQARYQTMFDAEEERLKAERPDWANCRDGLESAPKRQLYRQMHMELKMLQAEYSCLFTEDIPNDESNL